jgi:hypothetical protein
VKIELARFKLSRGRSVWFERTRKKRLFSSLRSKNMHVIQGGEAEYMRLLALFAGQRFFLLQMLQDKRSLNGL